MCRGAINLPQVVVAQSNLGAAEVLLEPVTLRRPGDRYDPRFLRQQPRERDLRGRGLVPLREPGQPLNERQIRLPIFGGEARDDVAEVRAVEGRRLVDLSGEEAFAERAERNEADPELLEDR